MNVKPQMRAPLVVVWSFRVPLDKCRDFESAYGTNGLWVQFFRRGEGYIRTELHRDTKEDGRYFTLDFWQSRHAFHRFKEHNIAEYKSLDQRCSSLTTEETFVAEYETLEQVNVFLASHGFSYTNVRPASPADLPAILTLEKSSSSAAHWQQSAYESIFSPEAPDRIALVLEDNEQVRGFIIARISGSDCELENIVVDESSRRHGFGRMLLHTLIVAASLRPTDRLLLEVRESNQTARAFYEKLGFAISTRRRSYYTNPAEDAVLYQLTL